MEYNPKNIYIGRIEKFEGDVIINSLGIDTTNYGDICRSIVEASKSSFLKDLIKRVNTIYSVGDYFITPGYETSAENIIHLIAPHSKDDKNMVLLKDRLRRIFSICLERGWKRIGIPSIGTGANKYDKEKVKDLIYEMGTHFEYYNPGYHFYLVLPDKETSLANKARLERASLARNGEYHSKDVQKSFEEGAKNLGKKIVIVKEYGKSYFDYINDETLRYNVKVNEYGIKNINDYIILFTQSKFRKTIDKKAAKARVRDYLGYGSATKSDYHQAGIKKLSDMKLGKAIDKDALFKIAFALRMESQEAQTFLNFFGFSFAYPNINPKDDLVKRLLDDHIYGLADIESSFKDQNIQSIFFN